MIHPHLLGNAFKAGSNLIREVAMPYIIRLRFSGGVKAVCRLKDEVELENLVKKSPFTSRANRWGDEIYFELPTKLKLEGEKTLMEIGEVAYWPEGNSLCLFFGPTPVSKDEKPVAYSDVKPLGVVIQGLEELRKVKDGERVKVMAKRE